MAREPRHEVEEEDVGVEPLVHGVIAIDSTKVGTAIDTGPANITQILFTAAPTSYEVPQFDPGTGLPTKGYFTLIDSVAGSPARVLYSVHTAVNGAHSPHATHKQSGYNIPFSGNLVVQSCPTGATFSITTA